MNLAKNSNPLHSEHSLSVFDLDHTLLNCNASFSFGKYLYKINFFSTFSLIHYIFFYFLHKIRAVSISSLHQQIFKKLFASQRFEEIDLHAKNFVDLHFHSIVYTPAFECLLEAKRKGHNVAILSSSPDFLVAHFARHFGVKDYFGTFYHVDEQGKFSHIERLIQGETKRKYVEEYITRLPGLQVIAYSDSSLDLPLLEAAHVPIGVNPDFNLYRHCKKNNWKIL